MHRAVGFLVLCLVAVIGVHISVNATYGVSVEVGLPKTAKPGDLVTHVFLVKNTGTAVDQYKLEVTLPTGWTALPVPGQVSLGAGESTRVFVTVMVPSGATAGTYAVVLRATSASDPSVWAEAKGVIQLVPTAGLVVKTLQLSRAPPGTEARHVFRIRNTGNVIDTYRIDVRCDQDWTVRVSQLEVQVLPGDQAQFTVTVLIPPTVAPGTRYYLWIDVTSTVDPSVKRELWETAYVAPPPPEKVRVEVYPELPFTVWLALTEEGDPSFKLSLTGPVPGIGRLNASRSFGLLGLVDQDAAFYTTEWGAEWGTVSVSGAFCELSGEGLRFLCDGTGLGGSDLLITDDGKGTSASLEWEQGTIRLISVGITDTTSYSVNEIQFSGRLSEPFSLAAILADARSASGKADAFQIRATMQAGSVSGHLESSEVSPDFPERTETTSFGWGLSFGGGESALSGGFSTERSKTLAEVGPPKVYVNTESFKTTATFSPTKQMSLTVNLKGEEKESDDTPKTTDEGFSSFNLTFSQVLGRATWSLGSSFSHAWDEVAGTSFLTTGLDLSAEAPFGEMTFAADLSLEQILNLITGAIDETSSSFSLSCTLPQVMFTPTVKLSAGNGECSLSADLSWVDVAGWELKASWELSLAEECEFSTEVEFTFPVLVPVFGPTYGIIRGRAFIDENKNGRFDPGEEGVPNLLLSANGAQAITGSDGRFVFWPLLPGHYQVGIAELPFGLSLLRKLPIEVTLRAGQEIELSLPMESKSQIGGTVFHDLNKNGVRDAGEPGVAGVEILIRNLTFAKRVYTDSVGRFSLEVPPGTYTVELVVASLPARFEPTTPTRVQVLVKEREFVQVQFGAWQRPREIIFVPQVPIARFEYTPALPTVGEQVVFDASGSEAPAPAEIVSYEWEFRKGPTVVRASGERVTVIFEEAGTWLVILKVTDSAGRTAQLQRVLTVH